MSDSPIVYPRRISQSPDVVVIGGGIIGLSVARALQGLDLNVDVIEAHSPGAGASSAAAGMLSPLGESHDRPELARTLLEANRLWGAFAEGLESETGMGVGYAASGSLLPAFDTEQMESLDRIQAAADAVDEPFEAMEPADVERRYPELRGGVRRALRLPTDAIVDPVRAIEALSESLFRRGIIVHRQRTVERISEEGDGLVVQGDGWKVSAHSVVLAAGAWTNRIAGIGNVPVSPVRGQMISFLTPDWSWQGAIRTSRRYAVRRDTGELLVGATVEDAGFDASTTESARNELSDFAHSLFPKLRWKAVARHWSGLRPAMSDGIPVLGRLGSERIVVATGHYRNGVLLAPWTAKWIRRLFRDQQIDDLPEAYRPDRFGAPHPV